MFSFLSEISICDFLCLFYISFRINETRISSEFHIAVLQGSVNDACAYADVMAGELVVGGVFLRLFIANPSWQVRHPKQFATELMERVLDLMIRPTAELETVTSAFVALISNHPSTADQVGYKLHRLI